MGGLVEIVSGASVPESFAVALHHRPHDFEGNRGRIGRICASLVIDAAEKVRTEKGVRPFVYDSEEFYAAVGNVRLGLPPEDAIALFLDPAAKTNRKDDVFQEPVFPAIRRGHRRPERFVTKRGDHPNHKFPRVPAGGGYNALILPGQYQTGIDPSQARDYVPNQRRYDALIGLIGTLRSPEAKQGEKMERFGDVVKYSGSLFPGNANLHNQLIAHLSSAVNQNLIVDVQLLHYTGPHSSRGMMRGYEIKSVGPPRA